MAQPQLREGQTGTAPDGTRVVVRDGQVVPLAPKMPVGVNNAVRQELGAVRGAGSVNTLLNQHRDRIEGGDLNLGPVANIAAPVRNALGMGDENSRNYQSLKSDLERMRNESLRLNTGVQTEGDAQRAWNELFQNLSDEQFVLQRMSEIEQLNQRAIAERRSNVDSLRMQYGYPEITDKELFPGSPAAASPLSGLSPAQGALVGSFAARPARRPQVPPAANGAVQVRVGNETAVVRERR